MKKVIIILLGCFLGTSVQAQNYEQQGDELFAQAQYDKAVKKFRAAIEMGGSNSSVNKKLDASKQCQMTLTQAIQAEQENNWSAAASLYEQLYSIHPISTYKSKSDNYKHRILAKQQEEKKRQEAAEAERRRQEQVALEAKKRKEAEELKNREAQNSSMSNSGSKSNSYQPSSQSTNQNDNCIKVYPETYDFGKIKENEGKVVTTFTVKNISQNNIVIAHVKTSCGCTSPQWSQDPILPQKTGQITITYNPNGRPGKFLKSVTIYTSNGAQTRVSIKGEVIQTLATTSNNTPQQNNNSSDTQKSGFGISNPHGSGLLGY